ncbi:MAG: hypothetical protein QOF21_1385 [Actinomycetota bacterium]|jgi:hypothetical protein
MREEAKARLLAMAKLLESAEGQLGLFTTTQAREVGFTDAMLRTRLASKEVRRVHQGVYVFSGHQLSPAGVHLASVLAAGDSARSTHRAGAWLWGMTSLEQKPEITTVGERACIPGVRTHFTITPLGASVTRKGVPTSSAAETLLDLGAVLSPDKVRDALDRGIANKILTPMSALHELQRRGGVGVRGTATLRALLDAAGVAGSHHPSVLEAKTRRLIQKAGLPQPECELVVGAHGEYRLDFCWPDLMLAIEVDGWMYHSSSDAFHGNKTRKNSLTVAGYLILEYTWIHVTKTPSDVIRELRAAAEVRRRFLSVEISLLSNGK